MKKIFSLQRDEKTEPMSIPRHKHNPAGIPRKRRNFAAGAGVHGGQFGIGSQVIRQGAPLLRPGGPLSQVIGTAALGAAIAGIVRAVKKRKKKKTKKKRRGRGLRQSGGRRQISLRRIGTQGVGSGVSILRASGGRKRKHQGLGLLRAGETRVQGRGLTKRQRKT